MPNADLKTKATKINFDDFLKTLPDEQTRADCKAIAKMMGDATKAKPVMWGASIVGFGDWHYVYESGRENDWFIMGFSPRKQNLTLYMMPGYEFTKDELARLGKHSLGKSCLYIKRLADVDAAVLKSIMTKSATQMKLIAKAPTAQQGMRNLKAKEAAKKLKKETTTARKSKTRKARSTKRPSRS